MVRADRRLIGRRAEQRAFRFLRREGLKPVARNYRCRHGEIDLIMLDADCLVFAEVRFRGEHSFVDALQSVDRHKRRRLIYTAQMFLAGEPRYAAHRCRFDVLGVGTDRHIDWLQDAFRPE